MTAQEIKDDESQNGPAGQDIDRLIRRPEHKEQAAEQEDDAGQAEDADTRRGQFKADAQQTD